MNPFASRATDGEKPFLIDRQGAGQSVSYREFELAVGVHKRALSQQLLAAGVRGRISIGLRMRPTPGALAALFAILRAHHSALLTHPLEAQTEAELRLLERTRAVLYDPEAQRFSKTPHSNSAPRDSPLLLLSSSGSSGESKIVALGPEALLGAADLHAARFGWREDDRWLVTLPLAHAGGLAVVFRAFTRGGTIVLPKQTRLGPHALREELERSRSTLVSLVPTQLVRLVSLAIPSPLALRVVLLGGAPASSELVGKGIKLGWPVFPSYGMTETCGQVATRCKLGNEPYGSVGTALPGVELRVDAADTLWVKSPSLFRRYLPPHAAELRDGFFRTGDRAELADDGQTLRILGRCDHMIITGGENVSPEYVEQVLTRLPGLLQVVVIGTDDHHWGQRIEAVLVPDGTRSAAELTENAAQLARAKLAPFQVPKAFHIMQSVPCSPLGKPLRHKIKAQLQAQRGDAKI